MDAICRNVVTRQQTSKGGMWQDMIQETIFRILNNEEIRKKEKMGRKLMLSNNNTNR